MKREKEFKEYLKNKLIDFAPCIEAYENGNMVHVELVSVKAGKNMIITWKDTETGKMFQTIE